MRRLLEGSRYCFFVHELLGIKDALALQSFWDLLRLARIPFRFLLLDCLFRNSSSRPFHLSLYSFVVCRHFNQEHSGLATPVEGSGRPLGVSRSESESESFTLATVFLSLCLLMNRQQSLGRKPLMAGSSDHIYEFKPVNGGEDQDTIMVNFTHKHRYNIQFHHCEAVLRLCIHKSAISFSAEM